MSKERLPVQLDPFRFAETGRLLEGILPLSAMKRLGDMLLDSDGDVDVRLEFGIDREGIHYITGRIQCQVMLACQRCLKAVAFEIDSEIALGIIDSHEAAELLPPHYEPLVIEDGPLFTRDLVEDELLLSLPLVPMHPENECAVGKEGLESEMHDSNSEVGRENPFSALAGLKTK